jgi:hypothetical protein
MYGIANGLIGFPSTSLRVRVTREEGNLVWVVTASLLDSGTKLVLDSSQVVKDSPATTMAHVTGLVTFG